ncbi:disintegrin and metalloproteinase domain-containing protein 10-like isoform X2 [Crassostrea virginica]|uniref:ADAM10 endopeptidase n=1 Tax=Crassostrea virginica TaxID=6565 RepID=A0A8B8CA41_CRAVI|nr:disintegrin and metalloproteinase domain-containing protein 10-like [Crassostrea virginica]
MRLCLVINVILCFLARTSSERGQRVLNDYIRHYEELHYDVTKLHNEHLRAKRSVDKSLELKFTAFGKKFYLDLWPSNSVFAHDHKSRQPDGTESHVDTSFIYDGEVHGVPGSHVHGAVLSGQFQGHVVYSQEEIYFIEPGNRYFRGPTPHTIIYREDHMNLDPYRHKRAIDGHHGNCGLDKYKNWMTSQSETAYDEHSALRDDVIKDNFYSKYSSSAFIRRKRSGNECYSARKKPTTCNLYLRADPVLFKETMERLGNPVAANNEILAMFSEHVAAINNIYQDTTFNSSDSTLLTSCFVRMNFRIQRTTIMTDESLQCTPDLRTTALNFCNPNIDVSNFLNLNSMKNHDEFCLAYVFTYRDFSGGTLGLAWVGSPSSAAGGVCERYKSISEGGRTVQKSLNTGIVTLINYGQRVPPRVSHITFAHEVGHNFGSPHDTESHCAPGGDAGNYIMYPSATKGNLPNNDKFSSCSKDKIAKVLNAVVHGLHGKTNCFTESDEAFCGNGIVEEGEECDCGYTEDCKDNCCNPRDTRISASADTLKCTLKIVSGAKVKCSPSQGPCCSTSCSFLTNSAENVCREATDCRKKEICNGMNATCPPVQKEPDMTYCNKHTQVCIDGVCQGSLCKRIGYTDSIADTFTPSWDECYISGGSDVESRKKMCYLACQKVNGTGTCHVSVEAGLPGEFQTIVDEVKKNRSLGNNNITVAPGTPCNDYRGYCDVFHRCRGVDNDGPLERLKNLIFGEETLSSIKDWIIEHWWAVMLISAGVIIVMGLFIKVFSYSTPSEDPEVKKQRERNKNKNPPVKNPGPYYISGRGGGGGGRDGANGRDHHYNRKHMETRRV